MVVVRLLCTSVGRDAQTEENLLPKNATDDLG